MMPIVGEIKKGGELGHKAIHNKMAWIPCTKCGKPRWVMIYKGEPEFNYCRKCGKSLSDQFMDKNPQWKGGKITTGEGYIAIKLKPEDPLISMATKARYVLEHRLIMARHLGRPLLREESIHHKNGIKTDNRTENLEIVMRNPHNGSVKCPYCQKVFSIR
jgi:hypothetical protein